MAAVLEPSSPRTAARERPESPSPLQHVEQRVQQRAASLALDMSAPASAAALLALVEDEIAQWNLDHRRGDRPFELADPEAMVERAMRNLTGFGPLHHLLADDDVWELMINGPDAIFVRRHRGPSGYHHEGFHDDDHVVRTLTKMLDEAGSHRKLDPAEGLQDAQLASGARVHIVHGDIARGGHLVVNVRKFTGLSFHRLDQLVGRDMLDGTAAAFLAAAVRARCSIVFSGAPGSGKTTLLSCCTAELDPALRVVTAEEVFELDIPLANVASMQTRAARADRAGIDLRRLVAGFLRMSPDVAIVGEVRDREALPLLLTLSSGVKGYTTIHAGSARQALTRLRFVAQLSEAARDLPMSALNTLVSESIDLVVHCGRGPTGPQVNEIVAVEDLTGGYDAAQFTVTELFSRHSADAPLRWTGNIPSRLERPLRAAGIDVRAVLAAGNGSGAGTGAGAATAVRT